ncbi:cell division protein FtsZ [Curvivirga aplysinae]|uniref:cell division protein FtsZ n=1 Tax=Curvivirga aplysinae TaxID=2529852 RepID=UPI0012BD4B76|nr:cell division protein FtsZ [Curvivirga aplysinae]MTI10775.1 cell division protein FtsZ [Curvivirga aplysinae]
MALKLTTPPPITELKPRIVVVGVGGAGGNAVNNMIQSNLEGVEFIVANTDAQALEFSLAERKVQLGTELTQGLGAGAQPHVGRAAAEEAIEELMSDLEGANMVFITAGMGGGTGTGAAPVIAEAARRSGILTVGVVTKPFQFEGSRRMRLAEDGIDDLQQYVDTLIIIPNQNLFRVANEKTTFADAFNMADDVLYSGVRGVTDLMVMPGLINLDFSDIRTVMSEMGKAMMGTGEAEGENRAITAAEAAISNPLLEDVSMAGARGILINITGGSDMTLFEVDEAANRIRNEVDPEANIIFGSTFDENLSGKMRVSVVATGIDAEASDITLRPTMPTYSARSTTELPSEPEVNEEEVAASAAATTNPLEDVLGQISSEPAPSVEAQETTAAVDAAITEAIGAVTEDVTDEITADDLATQDVFQLDSEDMIVDEDEEIDFHAEVEPSQSSVSAPLAEETHIVEEKPTQAEMAPILRPLPQDEAKETRPLRRNPMTAAPRDSFIPGEPAKAHDFSARVQEAEDDNLDPFAEAAMENAGKEPLKAEKAKPRGRLRSLFFKQEEQADILSHPTTAGRPQQATSQPVQSETEAGNGLSKAEEELLEIPSFLRRQAN